MRKILSLIITITIICSCKKSQNDAGTAIYGVLIHYVDSGGNDLFSHSNDGQNGYWIDSLNVYDITSSKKSLPPCYENTFNYQFQQLNVLRTSFCENQDIVNRYSYTLVNLKAGIFDTIKTHIDHNTIGPSTNYDSIWYNGVLKTYDTTGNILVIK
jgi:hypothetical protein